MILLTVLVGISLINLYNLVSYIFQEEKVTSELIKYNVPYNGKIVDISHNKEDYTCFNLKRNTGKDLSFCTLKKRLATDPLTAYVMGEYNRETDTILLADNSKDKVIHELGHSVGLKEPEAQELQNLVNQLIEKGIL